MWRVFCEFFRYVFSGQLFRDRYIMRLLSNRWVEVPVTINWNENRWFVETCSDLLTEEFKEWWEETEGDPPEYSQSCKKELKEWNHYWKRCGYALIGWNGYAEYFELGGSGDIIPMRFD